MQIVRDIGLTPRRKTEHVSKIATLGVVRALDVLEVSAGAWGRDFAWRQFSEESPHWRRNCGSTLRLRSLGNPLRPFWGRAPDIRQLFFRKCDLCEEAVRLGFVAPRGQCKAISEERLSKSTHSWRRPERIRDCDPSTCFEELNKLWPLLPASLGQLATVA
jgi:hypothetical protein